ncbi:MAG: M15 family metallopeptidase [Clostridia bacterium]|nr:M15 family metallopeptidase [Clostridia bacterium]
MAAKTPEERRKARKESQRRRARQNRITLLVLLVLCILFLALVIAKNHTPKEPTESTVSKEESQVASSEITVDEEGNYLQKKGSSWNLILVNDWNAIDEAYVATIPLEDFNASWKFDSRALPYLNQMIDDANAAGCDIWGQSLYRDYETQKVLYWRQVDQLLEDGYEQEQAEKEAATIVKRPGTSEHNTGLAVDFECSEYQDLDEGFENTRAFQWLTTHCAEYGFILRFPKDKESITGVIYEPWHYRYVGVEAAREITSRELCLEEYLKEKGL